MPISPMRSKPTRRCGGLAVERRRAESLSTASVGNDNGHDHCKERQMQCKEHERRKKQTCHRGRPCSTKSRPAKSGSRGYAARKACQRQGFGLTGALSDAPTRPIIRLWVLRCRHRHKTRLVHRRIRNALTRSASGLGRKSSRPSSIGLLETLGLRSTSTARYQSPMSVTVILKRSGDPAASG